MQRDSKTSPPPEKPTFSHIEFEFHARVKSGEPSDYVQHFEGKIIASIDRGGDEYEEEEVGSVELFIFEMEAAFLAGEDLFSVADSVDSSTCEFYEDLYAPRYPAPKRKVLRLLDDSRADFPNVMLLASLKVKEQFRGLGFGTEIVSAILHSLGTACRFVACKPFPTSYTGYQGEDWTERRAAPGFDAERVMAWKRVRKFWKKCGFEGVPGTEYFVWPRFGDA